LMGKYNNPDTVNWKVRQQGTAARML